MQATADLSTLPDADEDLDVHVDKADEGEDPRGEGWVPDEGQGVPEDEGWVTSCLAWINLVSSILLRDRHLHELGDVEGEGQHRDGDDVDKHPLGVAHSLTSRRVN